MYFKKSTLDDLLRFVFRELLSKGTPVVASKGSNTELFGVVLELTNPRARLSQTETKGRFFSAFGELLWYLSGSDSLSFIQHYIPDYDQYSDDGKSVWGAYGPRLFNQRGINQLEQVRDLLQASSSSRKAVIQLFNAEDILTPHKDVPCTCALQFAVRKGRLTMLTMMRSNDAFLGLPHDIFCFTMLQEILARELSLGLGSYKHVAASLHLYDCHKEAAQKFIDEGWQSTSTMPEMPRGDPWPSIRTLLSAEKQIRLGNAVDTSELQLSKYWADLVRLLQIFAITKGEAQKSLRELREVAGLKKQMTSDFYNQYIRRRTRHLSRSPESDQLTLIG